MTRWPVDLPCHKVEHGRDIRRGNLLAAKPISHLHSGVPVQIAVAAKNSTSNNTGLYETWEDWFLNGRFYGYIYVPYWPAPTGVYFRV
ncbi:hypothetical protein J6590_069249 [Homalodisca vitripennis]|nr:hypothetical protein J6590_069249 [Homalodisca vitripennis]